MVDRLVEILDAHVRTCAIISHNRAFLERSVQRTYEMKDGKITPA